MDVRKIVLLVGALAIAALTAIMAKNMFTGASAPKAQAQQAVPTGPEVLVATRPLPVGTIIDPTALKYQPWPKDLVQKAYYQKSGSDYVDPAQLVGTVVRNEVTAGQPVTQGSLIKPGERGFLAAALGPGMRAITVSVSATTGVAGFVFPGDRVDVMLTQTVAGVGQPLSATETFLRNVRVLAIDQRTYAQDEAGKPVLSKTKTVTLEATPKIAEKIQVAATIGKLSLALRSLADDSADLERAIAMGEVEPEGNDPASEQKMLAKVASRPMDTGTSYVTGADVSRFQRRTVPIFAAANDFETAAKAAAAAGTKAPAYTGPTVRVARGQNITVVPVGAK